MESTTTMLRVLDIIIILLLIGLASTINCSQPAVGDDVDLSQSQTYIILTKTPEPEVSLETWYQSFLPTITTTTTRSSNQQQPQILHSYRNVVTGFAARLTSDQVKAMEDKEGFLSALPDKTLSLQTTRTPNFLGLVNPQGLGFWNQHANYGKGMIIGVVDSGIIPNHPSFGDEGIPPPPAKWKGKCEFKAHLCNNKLIGARNVQILTRDDSPYDDDGHGSHTAGTAAGNFVRGANMFGNAYGTAAGVAPHSHLAIYRACTKASCLFTDVLAAMDVAVEDGVDVLSLSIIDLTPTRNPFHSDLIAIGAFRATQYFGVFVSCAAANFGPHPKTLSNEAPWILTVGASTIDRTIKATARLGNGAEYDGQSLFQPRDFKPVLLHLVYAGSNGNQSSALCLEGSLRNVNVRGKIVACDDGEILRVDKGKAVRSAGGAAMIVVNLESEGFTTEIEPHVLPATQVSYASGLEIKAYISSTRNPKATILFGGTVIGNQPLAPAVGYFSSRGPSKASPGILKPDIIGPGVNILAAWPFSVDNSTKFNVISGTSMSCPHLSGIAALLKSCHPNWSPTAIKSAIMTTADVVNRGGKPIVDETLSPADLFAIGAGHVNPSKANDPGLVYDLQPEDYIPYLCGLKYTDKQVEIITQSKVKCSKIKSIPETQLNYPSFSVIMGPKKQRFARTVTNVGEANSTYILELLVPQGIGMKVQPKKLAFTKVNQKATYAVEFIPQTEAPKKGNKPFGEGYLKWISGKYSVRSPISITFA